MICQVCGERATGYHYDVISCGGCKTFFRRAIIAQREFECNREGECTKRTNVSVDCRKCRFDKCIEIGMNPLAIVAIKEPEKNSLITKVLRRRKRTYEDTKAANELTVLLNSPQVVETTMNQVIFELISVENGHQRLRRSIYIPTEAQQFLEELLIGHSRLGIDYGDCCMIPSDPRPPLHYIPMEIRIRDRLPIGMIPIKKRGKKYWPHEDVGYSIEYVKALPLFHRLESRDKLVLTRHVSVMCSLLTSAFYSFERRNECTVYPDGTGPRGGTVPKEALLEREIHLGIIRALQKINLDVNEYVLLKGLLVCNPAIEGLSYSAQSIISKEQKILGKILLSYQLAKKGMSEGPPSYVEMLSLLTRLLSLAKRQREQHLLAISLGILRPPKRALIDDIYQL